MRHSVAYTAGRAVSSSVPATMAWPAIYCVVTLTVWTTAPFLRRVLDWKTHFAGISPLSALPLVMLVPAVAFIAVGRSRTVNRAFEVVIFLWLLGFGYALLLSFLGDAPLGGLFTCVQFCLPLGFAYWIATRPEDSDLWYRRISLTLIVLACVTGIYGVIQYVLLPPWDAAWMRALDVKPFGEALPFEVRVFSMLNSPATFAVVLTVSTIMYLPRLTLRSGAILLPIFAGLGLSLLRAAWLVLPLSILVFAVFTGRRKKVLAGLVAFVCVGLLGVVASSTFGSASIGDKLQTRLASLGDIAEDTSAQNRGGQIMDAVRSSIDDPEGGGLGIVGVSTRLNSADESATTLDSGYLSRFLEMGIPGTIAFLGSLGYALCAAIRVWREAVRSEDSAMRELAAVAIAMQVAMLALNIFGDYSNGLAAVVAWTSLALILRGPVVGRTWR